MSTIDQIRELFDQACKQPRDQRLTWLADHCADEQLRTEIEDLLLADQAAERFLDNEQAEIAASLVLDQAPREQQRTDVGNYRIIEPIARGGMGEVYRAERVGAPFKQQVALKVTRFAAHSLHGRQRFLDEQRILARLEHPNIARLIDGGIWESDDATADGRPYLAMEFVDGEELVTYCNKQALGLHQRLKLFQTICRAVHYAHTNLVVHRDLKPANILVSNEGRVKLLDFGVATLLADEDAPAATRVALMTPEYAAPEQVLGKAVTTLSDVYSLGVILYELISGQRPFEFENATPADAQAVITQSYAKPPSQKAHHTRWAGQIHSDLDKIVLKTLSKDPQRRYASANMLSEDIQRYLDGLPVQAQPDVWSYRARKFLQRHRWQALAAAGVAVLLIFAAVKATLSERAASHALEQVRIEAQKSKQTSAFLSELFAAADPRQTDGEAISVEAVLNRGVESISQLEDQPEVQGVLLSEMGGIYTSLGKYEKANELLARASELQRATLGPLSRDLADTLHRWAIATDEFGTLEDAEPMAREALEIRKAILPANDPDLGESYDRLGAVIGGLGRYQEAEPFMRRAVDLLLDSAGVSDRRTLTAMHNLAWLFGRLERYTEAEATYREVIRGSLIVTGPNDPELLVSRDALAVTLRRMGELAEAEEIYRDVLSRRQATLGNDHYAVGMTQHNLARLLAERGELEEALQYFDAALANWRVSLGPEHSNIGVGLSSMGQVQQDMGNLLGAEKSYRAAIALLETHRPYMDPRLADAAERLAGLLTEKGQDQQAKPYQQLADGIRSTP